MWWFRLLFVFFLYPFLKYKKINWEKGR
uniref:Uncharacterized protein n=1 Tax=Rhizophora mucronata TaxID=61149 RepID=A0A2P2Q633_RHIMU